MDFSSLVRNRSKANLNVRQRGLKTDKEVISKLLLPDSKRWFDYVAEKARSRNNEKGLCGNSQTCLESLKEIDLQNYKQMNYTR